MNHIDHLEDKKLLQNFYYILCKNYKQTIMTNTMKKLLTVCLMFCLSLTAYLQAQNLDSVKRRETNLVYPNPQNLDSVKRRETNFVYPNPQNLDPVKRRETNFVYPHLNVSIAIGMQKLACGYWEACQKNSKIQNNFFIDIGIDIFLANPYWSIPINFFNAKSNNHKIEALSSEELVLETLEIAAGIRRHHLIRHGKYNVIDYYYGLGRMLTSVHHYSGNFQHGFSNLQNILCQNAIYCTTGSGTGFYIDLGIQYSIKAKITIGVRLKRSSATHMLDNKDSTANQDPIKINSGGKSIGSVISWNF